MNESSINDVLDIETKPGHLARFHAGSIPENGTLAPKKQELMGVLAYNRIAMSLALMGLKTEMFSAASTSALVTYLVAILISRLTRITKDIINSKRREMRSLLIKEHGTIEECEIGNHERVPAVVVHCGESGTMVSNFLSTVNIEGYSTTGSGFIISCNGLDVLVSAQHVLDQHRYSKIASEKADVQVASLEECQLISEDFSLPKLEIDTEMTNEEMIGREVAIVGHRRGSVYKVQGHAIQFNDGIHSLLNGRQRRSFSNLDTMFCVAVDNQWHKSDGLSGSPVIDIQTGKVIGVFHSRTIVYHTGDCLITSGQKELFMFSGPEQLRSVLNQVQPVA